MRSGYLTVLILFLSCKFIFANNPLPLDSVLHQARPLGKEHSAEHVLSVGGRERLVLLLKSDVCPAPGAPTVNAWKTGWTTSPPARGATLVRPRRSGSSTSSQPSATR